MGGVTRRFKVIYGDNGDLLAMDDESDVVIGRDDIDTVNGGMDSADDVCDAETMTNCP